MKKLCLAAIGACALTGMAFAERQTVVCEDPDGLKAAIKAASYGGKPGTNFATAVELVLKPGVYDLAKLLEPSATPYEKSKSYLVVPMHHKRHLVVRGTETDPSKTVLVGGGEDVHAFGSVANCRFENLTFRSFHSKDDAAVFPPCGGHARYEVENCVFEDCSTERDGGVGVTGTYRFCTFRNCRAGRDGGALARKGWAETWADDCTFENCVAGRNGGGLVFNYCRGVSNCTFRACKAQNGYGGAAAGGDCFAGGGSHKGHIPYVNCVFEDNFATFRFPAERRDVAVGGCAQFENCTFRGSWMNDSGKKEGVSFWGRLTGLGYGNSVAVKPGDDLVAARDFLRANRKPGGEAEVVFEDGVYELKNAIVLTERDAKTTWRAKNPGHVTIVGGWNFRGRDMKKLSDESVLARLPREARDKAVAISVPADVRTNFVLKSMLGNDVPYKNTYEGYNGKGANTLGWCGRLPTHPVFSVDTHYMHPAQWPNGIDYFVTGENGPYKDMVVRTGSPKSNAVVRLPERRSDKWRFEDADIYAMGFLHGCEYSTERAYVPRRGTEAGTVEIADSRLPKWARFRFVNVMEELDAPGEWCYDRRTGLLVLYPRADFSADSVCALGTMADHIFHVLGSDITIEGFNFTAKHSHPAVCVEGPERVRIRGCRFSGLEYWACFVSGRHCEVRSCDFAELPADGLYLCGGNQSTGERGDNLIENCHATLFGFMRASWQCGGFFLQGCGNTMRHCQADNSQESGFEWHGVDQLVEYCRVYNCSYWNGDSGGVYTGGGLSASFGNVFRYNDIAASPGYVNGIYCDDCTSGNTVYGNLVRGFGCIGIFIGGGRDNRVHNNIVISEGGDGRWTPTGLSQDLRGLAWKQLRSPSSHSNTAAVVRKKWDPETSPVVKNHPEIRRWLAEPGRIMAPFDNSWCDNVVIDCKTGGASVGTGSDKMSPDFRIVSKNNLHIRPNGSTRKDDPHWMLGGFKTIDGTTNAPLDVGFVDSPPLERDFHNRQFKWRKGDFTLKGDSVIFKENPNFKPIPFKEIGLYTDEWRTRLPE